jgi:transglutaminase-like putative cysteine protease
MVLDDGSGHLLNDPSTTELQASTHAWSEVYMPGDGWRGVDSISGQVVVVEHIATAVHRHPEAVSPIAGSFLGTLEAKPKLSVELDVVRP